MLELGYILATPSVAVALEVGKEDTELTQYPMDADKRREGLDWPLYGVTMTGLLRLDVLELALKYVVQQHVPGDFLEAGVWRGGSSIFARAAWNILGQYHRSVHVADSFAGLPPGSVEQDKRIAFHKMGYLAVSLEDVKANFERFGLNPEAGVHFYKGFFNESLPAFREVRCDCGLGNGCHLFPCQSFKGSLSVLRLDGDMYESATDQLYNLYDFVSLGGWIIVDDYNTIPETQSGVNDFLKRHNAREKVMITHDGNAVWVPAYVYHNPTTTLHRATG